MVQADREKLCHCFGPNLIGRIGEFTKQIESVFPDGVGPKIELKTYRENHVTKLPQKTQEYRKETPV